MYWYEIAVHSLNGFCLVFLVYQYLQWITAELFRLTFQTFKIVQELRVKCNELSIYKLSLFICILSFKFILDIKKNADQFTLITITCVLSNCQFAYLDRKCQVICIFIKLLPVIIVWLILKSPLSISYCYNKLFLNCRLMYCQLKCRDQWHLFFLCGHRMCFWNIWSSCHNVLHNVIVFIVKGCIFHKILNF